jgi:hypothetical protein
VVDLLLFPSHARDACPALDVVELVAPIVPVWSRGACFIKDTERDADPVPLALLLRIEFVQHAAIEPLLRNGR